jgi:hypothetical protein
MRRLLEPPLFKASCIRKGTTMECRRSQNGWEGKGDTLMRKRMLATAAVLLTVSSAAFAQSTVIVTDPEPTGSVVLPGEVRTYVMEQEVPSIVYEGDVIVGSTLPDTVEVHTIPASDGYAYTVVNERRVIVDPGTHRIIQVLE